MYVVVEIDYVVYTHSQHHKLMEGNYKQPLIKIIRVRTNYYDHEINPY